MNFPQQEAAIVARDHRKSYLDESCSTKVNSPVDTSVLSTFLVFAELPASLVWFLLQILRWQYEILRTNLNILIFLFLVFTIFSCTQQFACERSLREHPCCCPGLLYFDRICSLFWIVRLSSFSNKHATVHGKSDPLFYYFENCDHSSELEKKVNLTRLLCSS